MAKMYKEDAERALRNEGLVQVLLKRFDQLSSQRMPYNKIWDDITEFFHPTAGSYFIDNTASNPERRSRRRFDSTGILANQALSSKILNDMTNSGSRWFEFRALDQDIDGLDHVRRFLQAITNRVFNRLYTGTFRLAHIEATTAWSAYGTACVLREMGPDGPIYRSVPVHELYISENANTEVDLVMRKFKFSLRQLIDFFGREALPASLIDYDESKLDEMFEVLHAVMPNDEYVEGKKHRQYLRFKSCWILPEKKHLLKEGGYSRMPYIVFRFLRRPAQPYGGSPAMQIMAEIRMINSMAEVEIKQAQMISPAWLVAHDSITGPLRNTPNAMNYGGMLDGRRTVEPLLPPGVTSTRELTDLIEQKRMLVRSAFFVDPLINRENSIRTAAEVVKRSNEELSGVSPFTARYEVEYLQPMLDAELEYELSINEDLEVPEELQGMGAKIEFTGPLSRTHRSQELNNQLQWMQIVQGLAQVDPSQLASVNTAHFFRSSADLLSVSMKNVKSEEEMLAIQQQQQQQAQMQQMMEGGSQLSDNLSQLAKSGLLQRGDLGLPEGEE